MTQPINLCCRKIVDYGAKRRIDLLFSSITITIMEEATFPYLTKIDDEFVFFSSKVRNETFSDLMGYSCQKYFSALARKGFAHILQSLLLIHQYQCIHFFDEQHLLDPEIKDRMQHLAQVNEHK